MRKGRRECMIGFPKDLVCFAGPLAALRIGNSVEQPD